MPASRRWRRIASRLLAQDDGKSVAEWARSFTGGHGVDAVIDCLGPGTSGTFLMNAIYALRRGGKAINIGGVGEKTVMDMHWMMDNQIEFIGSNWFSVADGEALAAMAAAQAHSISRCSSTCACRWPRSTARSTVRNSATAVSPTS